MPIYHDLSGGLIPPARTRRTIEESFINTTALPSWLSVAAGTPTFNTLATSRGHFSLTSGAVSGDMASLTTSFDIVSNYQTAILWEVEGFSATAATADLDINIGLSGPSWAGAFARHRYNEPTLITNMYGVEQVHSYNIRDGGEYKRKRNLALLMLRETRELFVMEDGQVMAYRTHDTLGAVNPIRPRIEVTTRAAQTAGFELGLVRLTLFHP